jgi:hypothetical protein
MRIKGKKGGPNPEQQRVLADALNGLDDKAADILSLAPLIFFALLAMGDGKKDIKRLERVVGVRGASASRKLRKTGLIFLMFSTSASARPWLEQYWVYILR